MINNFKFYHDMYNDFGFEHPNKIEAIVEDKKEMTKLAKLVSTSKKNAIKKIVEVSHNKMIAMPFDEYVEQRADLSKKTKDLGFYLRLNKAAKEQGKSGFETESLDLLTSVKKKYATIYGSDLSEVYLEELAKGNLGDVKYENKDLKIDYSIEKRKLEFLDEVKEFERLAKTGNLDSVNLQDIDVLKECPVTTGDQIREKFDFLYSGSTDTNRFEELFVNNGSSYKQKYAKWISVADRALSEKELASQAGLSHQEWRDMMSVYDPEESLSGSKKRNKNLNFQLANDISQISDTYDVEFYYDPNLGYSLEEYLTLLEKKGNIKTTVRTDSFGNYVIRLVAKKNYKYDLDKISKFNYFEEKAIIEQELAQFSLSKELDEIAAASDKIFNAVSKMAGTAEDILAGLNDKLAVLTSTLTVDDLSELNKQISLLSAEDVSELLKFKVGKEIYLPNNFEKLTGNASRSFYLLTKGREFNTDVQNFVFGELLNRLGQKFGKVHRELLEGLLSFSTGEANKLVGLHWNLFKQQKLNSSLSLESLEGSVNVNSINKFERHLKELYSDLLRMSALINRSKRFD